MKRLISVTVVLACVLAVAPGVRAQGCSDWSNQDLRGTYTAAGNGWIDLSKQFPDMGMPTGHSPVAYVEAFTLDGKGSGTGWLSMNMGGIIQFKAQTTETYAIQADCAVQVTVIWNITEVNGKKHGGSTLTGQRVFVVVGKPGGPDAQPPDLELKGISVTVGGSQYVELMVARRLSMKH